jgi:nicotinate-nucleotide pyrophosphorylase (carboxylating)
MPSAPRLPSVEKLIQRLQWDDLDLAYLRRLAEIARDEDLAGLGLRRRPMHTGDLSTASVLAAPHEGAAVLVARELLIVCGLPLVSLILSVYGGRVAVQFSVRDGAAVAAGGTLATLRGDPRILLAAERTLLNFLQRLSGIATYTRRHVDALGSGRTRLLDTRKTTPGYRMLEKYAVAKIQPPSAALTKAVMTARRIAPEAPVEVEVDRLAQIPSALSAGADVVLLDNFSVPQLRRATALIKGRAFTEASGGITLKTLPRLAGLGLDFVSTGALVHHSVWVDIGLDWLP